MFVFKAIKERKVDKIWRWTWMFLEVGYFFSIYHIPSPFVLLTSTGLFGPSPSEVKANT